MSDKEALARVKIDKLLEESGWRLLDDNQKRKNVVLEQGYRYDKKTKFTDYLLLDAYSRPLAVIEAKKKDYPLRSAKAQAMEYATRLGVRYFYLSNGEEHLFCDVQDGVLHPSDSFLNQDELISFASQFYGLIGSASSPVDLSKLPLNDLYPDIISAIAQNPDMLSSLGANISTENIDKLKQLNDVMKSNSLIEKLEKVSIMGGFDGIKLKAELEDTRKKLIPIAEKLKESMNKQFAITCFSKISNSILMWSHYANKHTGFCVGYNFEKCRNWDALINLLPVLYSVERPSLPMGLIDFSNPKEIKLNNISDYVPELMMLLLSKSNKWDYEEEWRIVNHQSQLIDAHLLDLHTISHIYLGANISKDNEYLIRDVAKKLTIPISKYRISPDKYQLEIEG